MDALWWETAKRIGSEQQDCNNFGRCRKGVDVLSSVSVSKAQQPPYNGVTS